jgi:hypothetical protein
VIVRNKRKLFAVASVAASANDVCLEGDMRHQMLAIALGFSTMLLGA